MRQKISDFPLMAYLAVTGFFKGLKNDERGLSGVVVTVLLILVAVLAVILVWAFLGNFINSLWTRITGASGNVKEATY